MVATDADVLDCAAAKLACLAQQHDLHPERCLKDHAVYCH